MIQQLSKPERFVNYLEKLADSDDRGPLAMLRRGLGKEPGTVVELYPYVAQWVSVDAPRREENAYYLVAALFGLYSVRCKKDESKPNPRFTNFGASYAQLKKDAHGNDQTASVERRFVGLLNCHGEDMPDHLRHGVGLLSSRAVPIDWVRLLNDLRNWDNASRVVQRNWARAFWASESSIDGDVHIGDSPATV